MQSLVEVVQQVLIEGIVDAHFVKVGFTQAKAKDLAKKWSEIPGQYKSGVNILDMRTREQVEDIIGDMMTAWESSKTSKEKSFKRSGVQGLRSGTDYVEIDLHNDRYQALIPLNHTASRLIASTRVGASEGKWCISSNNSEFWESYQRKGSIFVFLIDFQTGGKFAYNFGKHEVFVWDNSNSRLAMIIHPEFYNKFKEAVDRVRVEVFPWNIQNIRGLTLEHPRINADGSIGCKAISMEGSEVEKLKDLPIKIREVDQMIEVFSTTLSSLEGFPTRLLMMYVESTALKNLRFCPEDVGYMEVRAPLETLVGAPKKAKTIAMSGINCDDLRGLPKSVYHLSISNSHLRSLTGMPKEVFIFEAKNIKGLTSLEGSPRVVHGAFTISESGLTTLEGCPSKVGGDFSVPFNRITSLDHLPDSIGGDFILTGNTGIASLGSHTEINESIRARCKISGKIRI